MNAEDSKIRFSRLRAVVVSAVLALAAASLDAAQPCDRWRLLLRGPADAGDGLRFGLEYLAPTVRGRPWSFYGFAVADLGGDRVPDLERIDTEAVLRLVTVIGDGVGAPVYELPGWYRPEAPLVLYLIRRDAMDLRLTALGLQVEARSPPPLPEGFQPKFHGLLLPKILPLEPAEVIGLAADELACRARAVAD